MNELITATLACLWAVLMTGVAALGWLEVAALKAERERINEQLNAARKNDARDPKTGRFVRAA